MNRLFSFLLFVALFYQMVHRNHVDNKALVREPVRIRTHF
jgi:hypothetical protein